MKKTITLLVVMAILSLSYNTAFAQSIEFASAPKTYIAKSQSLSGFKVKYNATAPGTVYLFLKKDGVDIGNAVHNVKRPGSKTIDLSIWVWDGIAKLTKDATYSYHLVMWADPENVFQNLAAESTPVEGITLGKPKKKKKKKKKD